MIGKFAIVIAGLIALAVLIYLSRATKHSGRMVVIQPLTLIENSEHVYGDVPFPVHREIQKSRSARIRDMPEPMGV